MRRLTRQGNVQGDPPAGGRDEEGDLKSAQEKKSAQLRELTCTTWGVSVGVLTLCPQVENSVVS